MIDVLEGENEKNPIIILWLREVFNESVDNDTTLPTSMRSVIIRLLFKNQL